MRAGGGVSGDKSKAPDSTAFFGIGQHELAAEDLDGNKCDPRQRGSNRFVRATVTRVPLERAGGGRSASGENRYLPFRFTNTAS